jgi:hypothetical protein
MMITGDAPSALLPGLMHRAEWARKALNSCDRTAKRLQDKGLIVVRYVARQPYVDIEATAARIRGGDQPNRRRAA